jgi:chemotaxis protein MotB
MIPFLHRLPAVTVEDNPLWLVVLADMMTNLMLFFLILFAFAQQTPRARAAWAKAFNAADVVDVRPAPKAENRDFAQARAAAALKKLFADTSVREDGIRVRLKEKLLFPSARAALVPAAAAPLAKLARVLKQMPNAVVVEGYTDDVPLSHSPYRSNWELSVARSNSVIEELVRDGVPARRLVASGYGEYKPVAPNDTIENRARNRRVEILILRAPAADDE